jgi:hypothetical protein
VTVPQAGHSYVLDAEWRTVAELALGFLARQGAFPAEIGADRSALADRDVRTPDRHR